MVSTSKLESPENSLGFPEILIALIKQKIKSGQVKSDQLVKEWLAKTKIFTGR